MTETRCNLNLPAHIAIIMDGNGRWAQQRHLPRAAGHQSGVRTLRKIIEHSVALGLPCLTVYAFSSENWRRPENEVSLLMDLFMTSLREEVEDLHANGVSLKFIGNREDFPGKLIQAMNEAESKTGGNTKMILNIAADYGGRWDITRACQLIAQEVSAGELSPGEVNEDHVAGKLCLAGLPEPDLFIRTGGESRISNYLLWQLAYTELYFTDVLWPDFTTGELDKAIAWFNQRQRRFGQTSEQVASA